MASSSPRPTLAGISQITQRVDDPGDAASPIELMERAIREAAEDAGAPKMVESLDEIYVPQGTWQYGDPGKILAEQLGSPGARTMVGAISGHIVQILVNRAAQRIAEGKAEIIAIVGGESENSKRRIKREGRELHWSDDVPGEPDERVGGVNFLTNEDEKDCGVIFKATTTFAICDVARRKELGETPAQHRDRISKMYEDMSAISAANPYAWIQDRKTADEIRNPTPGNRMVAYPYTKLMTSNISVDQASALIICSEEAAARYGVPDAKKVYLRASTEMSKTILLSERLELARHPGQKLAAQRALEMGQIAANDIDHIDLYSCFPFAVQAGSEALGRDLDPLPSLTGGMTFFGGPFGNYVLHSKATMIERLRADPGSIGAIGSVGGSFAHFSYGLYSTDPGEAATPQIDDVSDEFAAMPRHPYAEKFTGDVTVESYTVDVLQEGPERVIFSTLNDDGARVWGRSHDADLMQALLNDEDPIGRRGKIQDGLVELD